MEEEKITINPEDIIHGLGKNAAKLLIQKHKALFNLCQSGLPLTSLKIIDVYLARINSYDESKRTVEFTKTELEQLLGVDRIRNDKLLKRIKSLARFVPVETGVDSKKREVNLFSMVEMEKREDGEWIISLTCSTEAKKYIFTIDKIGYIRYRLRHAFVFKSLHAYTLFLYVTGNGFRGEWEESIDELRKMLMCDKIDLYSSFKRFSDKVLKVCQKEICEKTPCQFSYSPVKVGKKVVAVKFKYLGQKPEKTTKKITESKECVEPAPSDSNLEYLDFPAFVPEEERTPELRQHLINAYYSYVPPLPEQQDEYHYGVSLRHCAEILEGFTDSQIRQIVDAAKENDRWYSAYSSRPGSQQLIDYLEKMYTRMQSQRGVKNEFTYLKKMIEQYDPNKE